MFRTAAIILAAGLSRRMGQRNKLLLPIGNATMVRHVVSQYLRAIDGPVVVVTGHEAPKIEAALSGLDVTCVFHANFGDGQQSSVAFGLRHCPQAQLVLIGLGDQPRLRGADLTMLLQAHLDADDGKVSIPFSGETRGNPIIVPNVLRPHLTANPDGPGCMRFTRENPDLVQRLLLSAPGFYEDVDTPDAYALLLKEEIQAT